MSRVTVDKLKWALVFLALALVLGGGTWYWMARNGDAPAYQTALVSRGEMTQVVTATGQLNPVVSIQVGSQISGIIQKLFVDFNSRVAAGQVIAQLEPSTYLANLRQAEGALASARAGLELARVKAARAGELRAKDLIPQADHDQAQADLHQAEATVAISEASVQKARVDVARCTIVAPIDGVVISRSVDVGQTVAASLSAPILFVIAKDLTKMQIDANVAEADIGGIAVDQDVNFSVDAFPIQTFRGRVAQVRNAPVTVQNVVTYDTIIEVANPDLKLKPGMTANVAIIVARREDALTIPNAALRFRPLDRENRDGPRDPSPVAQGKESGGARPSGAVAAGAGGVRPHGAMTGRPGDGRSSSRVVYVLPEGQASAVPNPVPVKTGISDGVVTEIVEGLREGDLVVTGLLVTNAEPRASANNPFRGTGRF
jgi:HlyD family secretion protein